jgi:hypothetical protein
MGVTSRAAVELPECSQQGEPRGNRVALTGI